MGQLLSHSRAEVDGSDRIDVIRAQVRTLRPDGVLHIREPAGMDHGMQLDEIRRLMKDAGLREQHDGCRRSPIYSVICDGMFIRSW